MAKAPVRTGAFGVLGVVPVLPGPSTPAAVTVRLSGGSGHFSRFVIARLDPLLSGLNWPLIFDPSRHL